MKECRNCGSSNIIKHGFTNRKKSVNSQRWRCKDCNSIMSEDLRIKRLTEADKKMIDNMVSEGVAYRKIQRILNFKSLYTIQGYLKKKQKNTE